MPPRIEEFVEPKYLAKKESDEISPNTAQSQASADSTPVVLTSSNKERNVELPIVWRNVIIFAFLHMAALYGVYCCFYAKWQTLLFAFIMYVCGGLGITAGAHRLWSHRTYKAKMPLRILLALFQTIALQVNFGFFFNLKNSLILNLIFRIRFMNGHAIIVCIISTLRPMQTHIMQREDFSSRIWDGF